MRLFVAVDLSDEVQRAAAALARRLREDIERLARTRASWVAAGNLHLTLRFLGEVDEATGSRVREAVSVPLPLASFDIELAGLGAFPPAGRPRVLWIGVGRGADALAAVHDEIGRRLASLGIADEDRPYRPHLTLARFREPALPAVRALIERAAASGAGACRVDEVVLYQSELSPKGPTYTALARGRFRGGVAGK